jgi:hypothetical protein
LWSRPERRAGEKESREAREKHGQRGQGAAAAEGGGREGCAQIGMAQTRVLSAAPGLSHSHHLAAQAEELLLRDAVGALSAPRGEVCKEPLEAMHMCADELGQGGFFGGHGRELPVGKGPLQQVWRERSCQMPRRVREEAAAERAHNCKGAAMLAGERLERLGRWRLHLFLSARAEA